MIDTINRFSDIVKDVFRIGQNVLPHEIKTVIIPIFTILIAILIYKIIRRVLI